jgi:hypothetical protein
MGGGFGCRPLFFCQPAQSIQKAPMRLVVRDEIQKLRSRVWRKKKMFRLLELQPEGAGAFRLLGASLQ